MQVSSKAMFWLALFGALVISTMSLDTLEAGVEPHYHCRTGEVRFVLHAYPVCKSKVWHYETWKFFTCPKGRRPKLLKDVNTGQPCDRPLPPEPPGIVTVGPTDSSCSQLKENLVEIRCVDGIWFVYEYELLDCRSHGQPVVRRAPNPKLTQTNVVCEPGTAPPADLLREFGANAKIPSKPPRSKKK